VGVRHRNSTLSDTFSPAKFTFFFILLPSLFTYYRKIFITFVVFCVLIKNLIISTAIQPHSNFVPCRNNKQFRKLTVCFLPRTRDYFQTCFVYVAIFTHPKWERIRMRGEKKSRNRKQICILNIFLMKFQYIHALLPCGDKKTFCFLGRSLSAKRVLILNDFFQT
jgi:hypothetical protein